MVLYAGASDFGHSVMAGYKKYVSRRIIEAKQIDHDFGMYDPRTSQRVSGRAGDYLVREPGGKEHIEAKEPFEKWHAIVPDVPEEGC